MYLRDGSAQTILSAATLRYKLQIKRSTSPSHSILTPGRPVPVLTLSRQAPDRVATGVPIFKSLVWLDPEKIPAQAGFEPGILRSRGGRLTTWPTRRCREPGGSPCTPLPLPSWPKYSTTMVPKCTVGCPEHNLTCSPDNHWDALELLSFAKGYLLAFSQSLTERRPLTHYLNYLYIIVLWHNGPNVV